MPSAARLVSAVCLMFVAFFLSMLVIPLMPESTDFGYFVPVNLALGLCVGWVVMGKRVGRGTTAAINNGLTGVFVLIFWGIGLQAINEMVRWSLKNRYDDPFEAIVAVFKIGAGWAYIIATVPVGVTALVGALVSGLLAEAASKRWR